MEGESDITYRHLGEFRVASRRCVILQRSNIKAVLDELAFQIPRKHIIGPAFCVYWFVSSVKEGYEVEIGYPVDKGFTSSEVEIIIFPAIETLSRVHRGPVENMREDLLGLYHFASNHAIISDEFRMEIYRDGDDPEGEEIELLFIIHNWDKLLARNLKRVLDDSEPRSVVQVEDKPPLLATVSERFEQVKTMLTRLDTLASDDQKYDILSSCAHVFPKSQINKLRKVFQDAVDSGKDHLQAVDAVILFMANDPGWGEKPRREGHIIYSSKNPRDPGGYEKAENLPEKRKAYCYCPLVRDSLDKGMPPFFCYCGSGWYRQQWEGAIGRPVRIKIVASVLTGDEVCTFAIYLPDDL